MANERKIALLGQPNSGKSTVFNTLTGAHQHVGNWPGKTVEKVEGEFTRNGVKYLVADLPGTYSLSATTAARMAYAVLHDEKVILPASTELCGEYGEEGLFAGVPCVIGENGVEQVVELPLTADEKATFHACCEGIRHNMEHLKEI